MVERTWGQPILICDGSITEPKNLGQDLVLIIALDIHLMRSKPETASLEIF